MQSSGCCARLRCAEPSAHVVWFGKYLDATNVRSHPSLLADTSLPPSSTLGRSINLAVLSRKIEIMEPIQFKGNKTSDDHEGGFEQPEVADEAAALVVAAQMATALVQCNEQVCPSSPLPSYHSPSRCATPLFDLCTLRSPLRSVHSSPIWVAGPLAYALAGTQASPS